jgi:hypothetical protein
VKLSSDAGEHPHHLIKSPGVPNTDSATRHRPKKRIDNPFAGVCIGRYIIHELPHLSYGKALAGVLLWSLLLVICADDDLWRPRVDEVDWTTLPAAR